MQNDEWVSKVLVLVLHWCILDIIITYIHFFRKLGFIRSGNSMIFYCDYHRRTEISCEIWRGNTGKPYFFKVYCADVCMFNIRGTFRVKFQGNNMKCANHFLCTLYQHCENGLCHTKYITDQYPKLDMPRTLASIRNILQIVSGN